MVSSHGQGRSKEDWEGAAWYKQQGRRSRPLHGTGMAALHGESGGHLPLQTPAGDPAHRSCVSTGRISAGAFPAGSGHSLGSTQLPHCSRWPGRARPLPFLLLSQLFKGCPRTKASKPLILSSTACSEPPHKISASG